MPVVDYRVDPVAPESSLVVDTEPAWSPDGRTIAFFHRGTPGMPKGIYTVRLNEQLVADQAHLVLPLSGSIYSDVLDLRFSPDGTWIAYWASGDVWVVGVVGGKAERVTANGSVSGMDWHPSGRTMVYARGIETPGDPGGLRIIDVDTKVDRPLLRKGGGFVYGAKPRWHPDGKSVIFWFGDPATGNRSLEYFRVFPDSSDYIRLTRNVWTPFTPHWYRNGEEIVFTAEHDRERHTYIMAEDGSNQRLFLSAELPVVLGTRFDFSPDFSKAVVVRPGHSDKYWSLWVLRFDVPGTISEVRITAPP